MSTNLTRRGVPLSRSLSSGGRQARTSCAAWAVGAWNTLSTSVAIAVELPTGEARKSQETRSCGAAVTRFPEFFNAIFVNPVIQFPGFVLIHVFFLFFDFASNVTMSFFTFYFSSFIFLL